MAARAFTVGVLGGFVGLLVMQPLAQAEERLKLSNFSQRFSRDVPVSGRLLVGAVIVHDGSPGRVEPRLLWRSNSAVPSTGLCVHMATRDGTYFGEGTVDPSDLRKLAGPVTLEASIERDALSVLRGASGDDLTMLAIDGNCRGTGETGLPAANEAPPQVHVLDRRATSAGPATLRLMLNSQGYTLGLVLTPLSGGPAQQARCRVLDDVRRNKAYNTVCEFQLPVEGGGAEIKVERRRYERYIADVKLRLSWARP